MGIYGVVLDCCVYSRHSFIDIIMERNGPLAPTVLHDLHTLTNTHLHVIHHSLDRFHIFNTHSHLGVSVPEHASVVDVGGSQDDCRIVNNHQLAVYVHDLRQLLDVQVRIVAKSTEEYVVRWSGHT